MAAPPPLGWALREQPTDSSCGWRAQCGAALAVVRLPQDRPGAPCRRPHTRTLPRPLATAQIGWQRGKRRRGATASVLPVPSPDRSGSTVVRFNERINFKSTLYKVGPA